VKTFFKKIIIYILQVESRLVIAKYKPKIIAITGSVGKTSTKDAIYAVISKVSHVRKSEKSYNSEVGLPLTILGVSNGWNNPVLWIRNVLRGMWLYLSPHKYPKWLVLEVGVGKTGDMKRTASWLKTDAVVITTIGDTPAHIEFFNSRRHLIEEKSGLIKTLKKDGVLALNADDESVLALGEKTKNRVMTFGFGEKAEVRGSQLSISYNEKNIPDGIIFRVDEGGASLPVSVEGVFGKNHVYAALAALTLASELKLNMLSAISALKNYDVPPGRMRLLAGINNALIIDDTYNSSPFACESALKTLGEIRYDDPSASFGIKRKIAVLGDMLELGKHTSDAHKNIGRIARENADALVVVGQRAQAIKEGAMEAGMDKEKVFEFVNSQKAGNFLKTFIRSGDLVLVKGSQTMRMERAVEAILADRGNKEKLLVRQDSEWLAKE